MIGFAIKVADSKLPEAIDLLPTWFPAQIRPAGLEREQKVILEEIKMVEDTPDELLGELFNAAYFPNHPLGRPIEGTEHTVSTFDHATTTSYHAHAFSRTNLVIAAAGNVDHERLVETINRAFADVNTKGDALQLPAEARISPSPAAPILIEHKKSWNKRT